MSNVIFKDDPSSRKVMRFLLLLQVTAVIIVIGLIILGFYLPALAVSIMTLIVFIAIILWLYIRYRKIPIVREKAQLQQQILNLQNKIWSEANAIQSAKKKREGLLQAEKDEINTTLNKLQEDHIEHGLANSYIKDATVPGIGPKLTERLAGFGILSAAQIGNKISEIPGFGEAKRQALMDWRSVVRARLDGTKPISLTDTQLASIMQIYRALRDKNEAAGKSAQENKRASEYELNSLVPRLRQLARITFVAYASQSLAPRGIVAALVASLLIITQLVSSVSAATSSIIASMPTVSDAATARLSPANTFAPTITYTPTITDTPTLTDRPTLTYTPPATAMLMSPPPLTLVGILPSQSAQAACSCSGDTLTCGHFSSQASVQSCYDYCISIGTGDIHELAGNHDGLACEILPQRSEWKCCQW